MIGKVPTVRGWIAPERLGVTLMHEHLLVDLAPEDRGTPASVDASRWTMPIRLDNLDDVRRNYESYRDNLRLLDRAEAVHEIGFFKAAGGGCIVDATSPGIGRDPAGLRAISEAADLHVVMGCGFYTSRFHPPGMGSRSEADLAGELIRDLTEGRDGIVAGLIGEMGLGWPAQPDEVKALRAAARAQRATGAPISIHPGRHPDGPAFALDVVLQAGALPERTIIDHLDGRFDRTEQFEALAKTGCYLEIDLFGFESSYMPTQVDFDMPNDAGRVRVVRELIERGYGKRILFSSDMAMRYHRKRFGGWGYDHIPLQVVPLMVRRGITEEQIDDILVQNPARVLARTAPVV